MIYIFRLLKITLSYKAIKCNKETEILKSCFFCIYETGIKKELKQRISIDVYTSLDRCKQIGITPKHFIKIRFNIVGKRYLIFF